MNLLVAVLGSGGHVRRESGTFRILLEKHWQQNPTKPPNKVLASGMVDGLNRLELTNSVGRLRCRCHCDDCGDLRTLLPV